mgnify:CR=1 FL=1
MCGPMVRATMAGAKTNTRRVVRTDHSRTVLYFNESDALPQGAGWYEFKGGCWSYLRCPYGVPGDRLWVRETLWRNGGYVADGPSKVKNDGKVPAIFMPRWDGRITLEVTAVRVERLQDISEEDARAEGIEPRHNAKWPNGDPGYMHDVARRTFASGWDSINGKRAPWASNPWVWVVTFKRLELAA